MGKAVIKHKKSKQIGKSAVLDKAINTKLEKRIQQIARQEVDKNKKQKLLCVTLIGKIYFPTIDDDKYGEARWQSSQILYNNTMETTFLNGSPKRQIYDFPKIKVLGIQQNPALGDLDKFKKYGTGADTLYADADELGYSRATDEIMFRGFKLSGKIIPNSRNKRDNIEIIMAVFKLDPNATIKQRKAQYMLASDEQENIMPKRLISEYLGSDTDGNALIPDTSTIKSRVFYKKWILNSKQDLYPADDAAELIYNEKQIYFSYFVNCNQKVKYSRGITQVSDNQKLGNIALNTVQTTGPNPETVEKIEFENIKYTFVCKSNINSDENFADQHAPQISVQLTNYFTDLT